jgi:hypothetical protein
MKTKDIIPASGPPAAVSPTADNPNGLAHEQAQMDVAIGEVQEDLLELYQRFIELRDTYARLKMRRGQTARPTVAEAGAVRRVRR